MPDRVAMPRREQVDPLFDGHPERSLAELTPDERVDWIWEAMLLVRQARGELRVPSDPVHSPGPDPHTGPAQRR